MKYIIVSITIISFLSNTISLGDEGYHEGYKAGEDIASKENSDYKSTSYCSSLFFGCLGGGVSYLIRQSKTAPGYMVVGKSPEYARGFYEGYEKKKDESLLEMAGASIAAVVTVLLIVGLIASGNSKSSELSNNYGNINLEYLRR